MNENAPATRSDLIRGCWATPALALMPAVVGMLAATATLVPGAAPVSPATLGAGAALAALALACAIQILYPLADASCPDRAAMAHTVDRLALPILACALTVAMLFLGLRLSASAELRQLGLFTATGVAAAALAAVFLVPRFLPRTAGREHRPLALTTIVNRWLGSCARHRRRMAVALAVCTLLAVVGLPRLRLEMGPRTISGAAVEARRGWKTFENTVRRAVQNEDSPDRFLRRAAGLAPTRLTREDVIRFGVLATVVSGGLVWLLFGRFTLVGIALLPVGGGLLWTLGALGLAGSPLSLSHLLSLLSVAGLAFLFGLCLLQAKLDPIRGFEDRSASVGASVVTGAVIVAVATAVVASLRHPVLSVVGSTLFTGATASLLAALFLVPLCMDLLTARRQEDRRTAATVSPGTLDHAAKLRAVSRRYRYQGPYPEQFAYWKMRTDPVFRVLDSVLPARGEFLDLGCGYGMASHWLQLDGPERLVIGVDFDAVKIRVAQASARGLDRLRFEQGDLLRWSYPVCDHVLLLDVLHYVPSEAKGQILRAAFAAMRPGGVLIVREALCSETPSHQRVARAERWAIRLGQNRTAHGLHFESRHGYEELLRQAGFAGVRWTTGAGLGSNALLTATR